MIQDAKSASGLSPGSRIDRYVIESELGSGGFATVYRATHRHTRRSVALKILDEKFADDPDIRERFRREAEAGSAILSKHVVDIFDWACDENGRAFMAMELCEGEPLSALLQRESPLPVARAVRLCLEILRGLEAAHSLGIVHRDVKPSNIFLARPELGTETVKVLDFGISKHESPELTTLTCSGQTIGSPGYMSPEQVVGKSSIDHRTDIYSVGIILFEMLTGRRPFEAKTYESYVVQVVTELALPVSKFATNCPESLNQLVASALSPEPNDRPQSSREFIALLERVTQSASMLDETVDVGSRKRLPVPQESSASPQDRTAPSRSEALPNTVDIVSESPPLAPPTTDKRSDKRSDNGSDKRSDNGSDKRSDNWQSGKWVLPAAAVAIMAIVMVIAVLRGGSKASSNDDRAKSGAADESGDVLSVSALKPEETAPAPERYQTSLSTGPIALTLYRHSPQKWTLKVDGQAEVVTLTPMDDAIAGQPWLDADGVQWIVERPNRLMFTGPGNPRSYWLPLEPILKP